MSDAAGSTATPTAVAPRSPSLLDALIPVVTLVVLIGLTVADR